MPCRYPWPARGSTVTCPGTSPRGHPFSGAAAVPGAGCRGAVAMPSPCKPFWSKNHAIRPCSDAFQGNPYSGNLPFFGKFRTNRQLAGIQEPYSLHIVEGNGPGSSGAGWNGEGRVQNKPNMLYESRQTRLEQLAAKKIRNRQRRPDAAVRHTSGKDTQIPPRSCPPLGQLANAGQPPCVSGVAA